MPLSDVIILEPSNGGLAAARALVRDGVRTTVIAPPDQAFIAASRGVHGHVVPYADWPEAVRELAGPRTGIITGADRASAFLADHHAELGALTFEALDSSHTALLNKDTADAIARAAGVRVPWTAEVASADDLAAVAADAPFPCVLKPVVSHEWRSAFGDERVFVAAGRDEALRAAAPAFERGFALLLSEYVPGGDDQVEEAIVVRATDGSYPVRFGCRKLRQFPPGFGAASICVSDPIPESMALAEALLDEADYVGVAGIETKRHAGTGATYFIEANVRLPTQFGLGDAAGVDATRRLVATLAGDPLGPQRPMRPGVKLVFPELEARAALGALRSTPAPRRPAALLALLRSYAGTRELGLLSPRDPGPAIARLRTYVRRARSARA